jgi:hypothetical protein
MQKIESKTKNQKELTQTGHPGGYVTLRNQSIRPVRLHAKAVLVGRIQLSHETITFELLRRVSLFNYKKM